MSGFTPEADYDGVSDHLDYISVGCDKCNATLIGANNTNNTRFNSIIGCARQVAKVRFWNGSWQDEYWCHQCIAHYPPAVRVQAKEDALSDCETDTEA